MLAACILSPGLVVPNALVHRPVLSHAAISMQEKKQSFDNDMSNWKPSNNQDFGDGKALHAGNFESTDTPDFFDENSDYGKDISTMDGVLGSSVQNVKKNRSNNPGVEGALDVNPDITVWEEEEIDVDAVDFGKSADIKMTDLDFDMVVDSTIKKSIMIDVRPMMMTYERFYCGFTSDSHPSFSCSPNQGKMENRNGPPTQIEVTCTPNGASGELKGTLCFILPDEKPFSTYYGITAKSI